MPGRLDNKVAIVTGAGSGIGRAAAQLFATEGAKVVCVDINEEAVGQTAQTIQASAGKHALAVRADVTVPDDLEHMINVCLKEYGQLDVLYANAGVCEAFNAIELPVDRWDRMMAVNLKSVWLSAKYALPHMIASGGGSIINQSSIAGLQGIPEMPHYCAAKTGVIGLTRQLAVDYGSAGVRVNAICPGAIPTPLMDAVWSERGSALEGRLSVDEIGRAVIAKTPMGRLGTVDDCANLALFLASEESSWISGVAIPLDGGLGAT
ncbi:MAG: SDR family oxidoreductase [Anaerolineales bacterium]